ncbi:hypothetical protein [Streptomyces sp. SCSIO 30461]|uniref:hypothetical protein n=1 Tax=Streptomyces sp. SCSIO 30461 TaxID=3118085 RepID=UPI00387E6337
MTNDLNTLATALYVRIDDTLQASPELAPWRPAVGIAPTLSDSELLTLAVMSALLGYTSERPWMRRVAAPCRCRARRRRPARTSPCQSGAPSLTHRVYACESSFSPDIVWTRLDHVDFTPAARLDPTADNLVGDATGRYEPREPFTLVLGGA